MPNAGKTLKSAYLRLESFAGSRCGLEDDCEDGIGGDGRAHMAMASEEQVDLHTKKEIVASDNHLRGSTDRLIPTRECD